MNVVMTGAGGFVEVQGTAEGAAFSRAEMDALLALADKGIGELVAAQRQALGIASPDARRGDEAGPGVEQREEAGRAAARCSRGLASSWSAQGALGIAEAEEPHATFVENALAKARHAARRGGGAAIADDSGLCVDALGGAPGVASAHFAAGRAAAAPTAKRSAAPGRRQQRAAARAPAGP